MDQADDLKAFERRMIEIISSLQPSIWRWRLILLILVIVTLLTFYTLIIDVSFLSSSSSSTSTISATTPSATQPNNLNNVKSFISFLWSNLFRKEIYFSTSFGLLLIAFLFGIHRKMFASSILIARFRYILADYNMSCDSDGRIIIKPRPATPYFSGGS